MTITKSVTLFISAISIIGMLNVFVNSAALAQLAMPTFSNDGIEGQVESLFADVPQMIAIAKCESGFRQFGPSGMPLRGGSGGQYIGVFQIGISHADAAAALGFDIYSVSGNLGYAKYMYQQSGTAPWSGCISNSQPAAPLATAPATIPTTATTTPVTVEVQSTAGAASLTNTLSLGIISPQVQTLQQILNAIGFPVALSGPGSKGQETQKFGTLTQTAVQKFQCSQGIICFGSAATTGYGLVGPHTRAALLLASTKASS